MTDPMAPVAGTPDDRSGGPPADEVTAPRARRRWPWVLAAVVLATASLVGAGVVIGYQVFNRTVERSNPPATIEVSFVDPAAIEALDADVDVTMPDVLELSLDAATEAIGDAGIDVSSITVVEAPYVGEPGRVVVQQPVRGSVNPTGITLTMSTPATVPDVSGMSIAEATAAVEELGAVAFTTLRYEPDATVDTVLASEPGAGAPLTPTVELAVATAPSSIFLDTLSPTEGRCSTGSRTAAGVDADHALSCRAQGDASVVAFDLAQAADRFRTSVALDDSGSEGSSATVRVVVDGEVAQELVAVQGSAVPVDLVVTGRRRLELHVASNVDRSSPSVVFLDPLLVGADDALDRLRSN